MTKARKSRRGNKNAAKPAPGGGSELRTIEVLDDGMPSGMVLSSVEQPEASNSPTSAENVQLTQDIVTTSSLAGKQTNPSHGEGLEGGASCSLTVILPSWPEARTSELEDPAVSSYDQIPGLPLIFNRVSCLRHLLG